MEHIRGEAHDAASLIFVQLRISRFCNLAALGLKRRKKKIKNGKKIREDVEIKITV